MRPSGEVSTIRRSPAITSHHLLATFSHPMIFGDTPTTNSNHPNCSLSTIGQYF
ncbi:hypothetical protein HYC85_025573 [Camellia sinensis]|uniref:Uncharacterized protein n=1 Tax=Camellia sinensis TaxID=4442 RepID=A0A7J7GBX1_CAMSI|nr:hypothetical protein HYC85_025573 [Camellia sinensis]